MREALLGAAVLALAACGNQAAAGTDTVQVGQASFTVQVADDPAERERGLSGRAQLPSGTGLLFTYPEAAPRAYWMPDMNFSIDLAWIADGRVLGVQTLAPCVSGTRCQRYPSPGAVDSVLEVPAGALAGTAPGTPVTVGASR